MSVYVTSLADSTATYTDHTANQVNVESITTETYSTVLITKVPDNAEQSDSLDASSIVYVGQESSTFETAANFLIKANPEYGKYQVQLGEPDGASEITYFYMETFTELLKFQ